MKYQKHLLLLTAAMLAAVNVHAQQFTDFRFPAGQIGWNNDFVGVINDGDRTITFTTQDWIDNIASLRAEFEVSGGAQVRVNGAQQTSGGSENDFRRDVVYQVGDHTHYTVKFESPQATGLPVIRIDTQNGAAINSKEYYVPMRFQLEHPDNPYLNIANTEFADSIRGRGNSTWNYAKKPYRIKFDKKTPVFGLQAAKSWILLAEYRDPTDLITPTGFQLGRVFDMPYTNTYQHVQVYLNGKYNGIYGFTEHRQADPDNIGAPGRVKIDENNGGWFVELCNDPQAAFCREEPRFSTSRYNVGVIIKSPEDENYANMNNPLFHYVRDDWNRLTEAMESWEFPENGYRDLINVQSFIDYIMTSEIVHNLELKPLRGRYAYKESASAPISLGPLWDFDYAYGIDDLQPHYRHVFFLDQYVSGLMPKDRFLERLFEDPVFASMYKDRWNEKFQDVLAVTEFTRALGEKIRKGMAEDAKRWHVQGQGQGTPGGWDQWNNPPQSGYNYSTFDPDHARQTENLISWWNKRCAWLDIEINKIASVPISVRSAVGADPRVRPSVTIKGRMLNISSPDNSGGMMRIRVIDVKGKTVARYNARATGDGRPYTFSLTKIPAGRYFVDVKGAGVKQALPVVVK